MVDIHCHVLFGVDDGSADLNESIEMMRIAREGGTDSVFATPHCNILGSVRNYWCEELSNRLKRLNTALLQEGIGVKVYSGQEIFATPETASLLDNGSLITLNSSRYALIEFDFEEYSVEAYAILQSVVSCGYVPIVAHPERYGFVYEEEDAARRLKDIGCLLQINKGSLKGSFGTRARKNAYRLLDAELADFIASDAHGPYVRTPFLADARDAVADIYSEDYAELLFNVNPLCVLNNKEIYGF